MNFKTKGFFQIILVGFFGVAILAPSVRLVFQQQEDISSHEKRRLHDLPTLPTNIKTLHAYPKEFEQYFNDHYGFRSDLIAFNQSFKRKWFNKSSVRSVVRGKSGWLFLDQNKSLTDHLGLTTRNEKVLQTWTQVLRSRQAWLKQRGALYFFVPVPNKMTIYQDEMPMRIRQYASKTGLDKLLEHLPETPFSAYINLESVFTDYRTANPEQQLYYKTDSHWTKLGAFIAYQQTMERLRQYQPGLEPPLNYSDLTVSPETKYGDIINMSAVGNHKREKTTDLKAKNKCAGEFKRLKPFASTQSYQSKQGKKRLPLVNGCKSKKYTAIIMHDSFGSYTAEFFSESFKRVVFMRDFDFAGMDEFIRSEKADFFIDMRVERLIDKSLIPEPNLLTTIDKLL